MNFIEERFNKAEEMILSRSFKRNNGFEEPYYVFDYDPQNELYIRERIKYLKKKCENQNYKLQEFDLYDIIINIYKEKNFLQKNFNFEEKLGLEMVVEKMDRLLQVDNGDDDLVVKYIKGNVADDCKAVILTGIGKCYPFYRAHYAINKLRSIVDQFPVILFYPGKYDGITLSLFSKIEEKDYYRAYKLVE